ncbi:MAG: four helix bundle protein, partial [Opitutales bacterium]
MKIERFEDVRAWQIARELTRAIYTATAHGIFAKDFALKDQIRRAAGST